MIERVRLDTDEDGYYLVLDGDFVVETTDYLKRDDGRLRLRLCDTDGLVAAGNQIAAWDEEGRRQAACHQEEHDAAYARDAYEPDDPKRFAFIDPFGSN